MSGLPVVSVVVPCYNYGRFLDACITSIVSQEGVRVRVLVIDDCSTDDSAEVAARLASEHDEVELRRHEVNAGHIATYNEGLLGWADGDYVTLLSADDELTPGSLSRSVKIMEDNPSVGLVYGVVEEFSDGTAAPAPASGSWKPIVYRGADWLRRRARQTVNVVPTPGTVLRTTVQHEVGGYNPLLTHAGDQDMWQRVALVADIGYVQGLPQGRYRVHGESMSAAVYKDRLGDVRQRKLVFDTFFEQKRPELAALGIRQDDVNAALASQPLWWACREYEKRSSVTPEELQEWVDFAAETYPDYRSLRAYRALQRRQRLGADFCRRTQVFVGTAVVRKLRNDYWWYRWRRFGG
jgi:hypothetical protein